jgi:indole-3-glycerol phosphate synthase
MSILDKIIANKKEELLVRKMMVPADEVINSQYFERKCLSLKASLQCAGATGIIAEFKRKSPSKGYINRRANAEQVTGDYTKWGASGLSVLTDTVFFGGTTDDLVSVRANEIPILRKDFIVDTYQILTTKALGADVILLIAAVLTKEEVEHFAAAAKQLGLEVLLEIHDESELGHICDEIDMVGINNRNLKTFAVDTRQSIALGKLIPAGKIKIAESGINNAETVKRFKAEGFEGFLIGEAFMKEADPGRAFEEFINQLK